MPYQVKKWPIFFLSNWCGKSNATLNLRTKLCVTSLSFPAFLTELLAGIKKKLMQWHYFFIAIFISKLVSNVFTTFLGTPWHQKSTSGVIIDPKYLNISEIELCLFQNKNDVLIVISGKFYIKCKQRVEKNFEDLHCNKKTPFWFHKYFFCLQ